MLDVIIVGSGIHGVHLAAVLLERGLVTRDRLRLIDPHEAPLSRWNACTNNVSIEYLRSPGVHHIGVQPLDLMKFANYAPGVRDDRFTAPYQQPAYTVFQAHARHVVEHFRLGELHIRGRVKSIQLDEHRATVATENSSHEARLIVLAIGGMEQVAIPEWAEPLRARGVPLRHVFDHGFELNHEAHEGRVVIVGGGLTAVQTALSLARTGKNQVTLLSRHRLRAHHFDADPGWMGPKYLNAFNSEPSYEKRREMILSARFRGSAPKDVLRQLDTEIAAGRVKLHIGEATAANFEQERFFLSLADGGCLEAEAMLLATGFIRKRPGGSAIDELIERYALQTAPCGFPIVDRALRWHPRIAVMGPLAELEVGPTSRNIVGAQRAAVRIADSLAA